MRRQEADMNTATTPFTETARISFCAADPYTPMSDLPRHHLWQADKVFTPAERQRMIAEAAYFRAARRGFRAGHAMEDWLDAEREINAACGLVEPHACWDLPSPATPVS
jgi:DUF2934 family protein